MKTLVKTQLTAKRIFGLALALVLVAGLLSCNPSKKQEETVLDENIELEDDSLDQQAKTKFFFQSLPSPLHIANIFKRSGVKFEQGITHNPDKANQYVSKTSKALNLGVYSADLAYFTINNQTQETISSLKAAKTLSAALELEEVFDAQNLIERFEANIGNRDSLLEFLADLAVESDVILKKAERFDIVFLSFAGAWVESMYIAATIAERNENKGIIKRIISQKHSLQNLIKLLSEYEDREEFLKLNNQLREIHKKLENASHVANKKEETPQPTDKQIQEVVNEIQALRKQIIASV